MLCHVMCSYGSAVYDVVVVEVCDVAFMSYPRSGARPPAGA